MQKLVLASTSTFRQQILRKLNIDFEIHAPDVNEDRLNNETPQQLVSRLAEAKAKSVSAYYPNALIIGSDQVAVLNDNILGKPLNHENAKHQLAMASEKKVRFYTGLCLYNSATEHSQVRCIPYDVYFRQLTSDQIENYLQIDKPYNCAGSFKSEGFGISLFEKLDGEDPNALVGLPLIELIRLLTNEGINIP